LRTVISYNIYNITKVGNIHMIRKQRNLLDAKMKYALVKCFEEIKRLVSELKYLELYKWKLTDRENDNLTNPTSRIFHQKCWRL
jgi:hypothetical protein